VFFTILSFVSGINKISTAITAINVIKKFIVITNSNINKKNNSQITNDGDNLTKKDFTIEISLFDRLIDKTLLDETLIESLFRLITNLIIDILVDVGVDLIYYLILLIYVILVIISKCMILMLLVIYDILTVLKVLVIYEKIVRLFNNAIILVIMLVYPVITIEDKFHQITKSQSDKLRLSDWNDYLLFLRNANSKLDQLDRLIIDDISRINVIIKLALNNFDDNDGLSFGVFHSKIRNVLGQKIDCPFVICHNESLRIIFQNKIFLYYW